MSDASLSPTRGRLLILLAAVMWSTSGAFTKLLTRDTALGLNDPELLGGQMACFRVLFAGVVLLPTLRRRDIQFRPLMLVMILTFAAMNFTYITAMAAGTAANAVLLQYTAPMWMYLASVWWLGEPPDRRSFSALLFGLLGIVVILVGGWQEAQFGVILLALGSGFGYAGVILFLRVLRATSPNWLTVQNHLFSGLLLLPIVYVVQPHLTGISVPTPSLAQWGVLVLFGTFQMGVPYLLMARGLRSVSAQEAGTITLLEPLLNPLWVFLLVGEMPSAWTFGGGAFILGALCWRYFPRRK